MTQTSTLAATGGCQCGAVRYALRGALENPHVCHCRMCQRATGGLFAALVGSRRSDFAWTRGAPTFFASSNLAQRGFCAQCGTPLSFNYLDPKARIYVTIGSLDDPKSAAIVKQYGVESKVPWVRFCEDVAGEVTASDPKSLQFFENLKSNQS